MLASLALVLADDVGYTDEAAVEGIVDAPPLFDDSAALARATSSSDLRPSPGV